MLPSSAHNEWRSAAMMDVWGLTWVASRKGNAPWLQYQAMDLVRAGARGKPFWHAEAEGGPLWMQPQVIGRPREDGRQPDAEDVRIWNLISCAGGARGILYPRWRPLLDGPLFGAFGPFAMDGSVDAAGADGGQRREVGELPCRGVEVAAGEGRGWHAIHSGIGDLQLRAAGLNRVLRSVDRVELIRLSSTPIFCATLCALEDIDEYKLLYLAYPVMLKKETADRLKEYVQRGGMLICEGVPGYFGDSGHVGTVQPNLGLDELFGAREKIVEFDPDLSRKLMFEVNGNKVYGRYFRQDYDLHGGTAAGQYSNGNIAAVSNSFGKGKTLLMGSFPGSGYFLHHGEETRVLFAGFLKLAGIVPAIVIDDNTVQARLHQGEGGTHIWVTNSTRAVKKVTVTLAEGAGPFQSAEDVWGGQKIAQSGRQFTVSVPPRDAVVLSLL